MFIPSILRVAKIQKLDNNERAMLLDLWSRFWDLQQVEDGSQEFEKWYDEYPDTVVKAFGRYLVSSVANNKYMGED